MSITFLPSSHPLIGASGPIPILDDVLYDILKRLPIKALLNFKQTCKGYAGSFTERVFLILRLQEYNYECNGDVSERPQEVMYKWAYILNQYMTKYRKEMLKCSGADLVPFLFKYIHLYPHCPPLAQLFERDYCLANQVSFPERLKKETEIALAQQNGAPTEFLLKFLFEMQNFLLSTSKKQSKLTAKLVRSYCQKAIDAKVDCIALFILKQIEDLEPEDNKYFRSIFVYAATHGHVDTFIKFCKKFKHHTNFQANILKISQKIPKKGPLLFSLANAAHNLNLGEKIIDEAIQAYGNNVPKEVWDRAIEIKLSHSKFEDAEKYLTAGIKAYPNHNIKKNQEKLAIVKCKLEKWLEADQILTKLIDDSPSNNILFYAFVTNIKLEKWNELLFPISKSKLNPDEQRIYDYSWAVFHFQKGNFYLAQVHINSFISGYDFDKLSPEESFFIGKVFFYVDKFHESEKYFDKALKFLWQNREFLELASQCKYFIGKYLKAEELIYDLMETYPKNAVPSPVLLRLVNLKLKCNKVDEAKDWLNKLKPQSLTLRKDFEALAKIYVELNDLEKANQIYDVILEQFNDFRISVVLEAVDVKYKLNQFVSALNLMQWVLRAQISDEHFATMGNIFFQLKEWYNVIHYFDQLSHEYFTKETLQMYGTAHYHLGNWAKTDQILTKCFGDIEHAKTFGYVGCARFQLGKFQEADMAFHQAIQKDRNSLSHHTWMMASKTKIALDEWQKADDYLSTAFSKAEKPTSDMWFTSAYIKWKIGHWTASANAFFQGIKTYIIKFFS